MSWLERELSGKQMWQREVPSHAGCWRWQLAVAGDVIDAEMKNDRNRDSSGDLAMDAMPMLAAAALGCLTCRLKAATQTPPQS